jgi:carboxyl-terminal processing protease
MIESPATADRPASAAARDTSPGMDIEERPSGAPVPWLEPVRGPRVGRTPIYLALFLVAVVGGSALFVSGFALGTQQAVTPGTSAQNQQLFEPFWEAWNKVTSQYVGEYDRKVLVEGAIKGVFEALEDPYSGYMTSEEYRASLSGISGEFEGIGAQVAGQLADGTACEEASATCRMVVVHVLRGSPALAAGMQDGDIIRSVDGESVDGKTLEEVVAQVRGEKGTEVLLALERDGRALELRIVRDVIRAEAVTSRLLADGEVGYLRIEGFNSGAADDFERLLTELVTEQEVGSIVLDLRDDPGGFVDAARTIASQFIASGPVYWEESADGQQRALDVEPGGVATDPGIELVVLVNGGTASASEIVAGALQDTDRATLVGEPTFGKGTIQQWHLLAGDSGGFRLSVAKWLTPDKTWVHGEGITPDVVVPAPAEPVEGEDPQLDRAVELLTGSAARSLLAA